PSTATWRGGMPRFPGGPARGRNIRARMERSCGQTMDFQTRPGGRAVMARDLLPHLSQNFEGRHIFAVYHPECATLAATLATPDSACVHRCGPMISAPGCVFARGGHRFAPPLVSKRK